MCANDEENGSAFISAMPLLAISKDQQPTSLCEKPLAFRYDFGASLKVSYAAPLFARERIVNGPGRHLQFSSIRSSL